MNREIAAYVDRLVALEKQKAEIVSDEADIKAEIKSSGLDPALIMKCVRLKLKDDAKRRKELDQIELFDTYLAAAGLIADRGEDAETAPHREEVQPPAAAEVRVQLTNGDKTVDIDPHLLGTLVDASKSDAGTAIVMAAIETVKAAPVAPADEEDIPEFLRRPAPAREGVPA